MAIILTQGDVTTTGAMIYGAPTGYQAYLTGMVFNNSSAYVLEVYIYRKSLNNKKLIYKFTLDANDHVEDDTEYVLDSGDFIWAKSSVSGTDFIIMGSTSKVN